SRDGSTGSCSASDGVKRPLDGFVASYTRSADGEGAPERLPPTRAGLMRGVKASAPTSAIKCSAGRARGVSLLIQFVAIFGTCWAPARSAEHHDSEKRRPRHVALHVPTHFHGAVGAQCFIQRRASREVRSSPARATP